MPDWLKELLSNPVFVGVLGAGGIAGVFGFVYRYWSTAWTYFINMIATTVTVDNSDDPFAFNAIEAWLSSTRYANKQATRLFLRSFFRFDDVDENGTKSVLVFTPAYGRHVFFENRTLCFVDRTMRDESSPHGKPLTTISITLLFRKRQYVAENLIPRGIEALNATMSDRLKVNFYMGNDWLQTFHNRRKLDTVFLKDGLRDDIIRDAKAFFESKQAYIKRGQPWRRGYLFEGEPGGGKSSMISALASELNLIINYISLSSIKSDSALMRAMSYVGNSSITVIEDIDSFDVTKERSPKKASRMIVDTDDDDDDDDYENRQDVQGSSLTLSGLLNATDGLMASEGRILIFTSNHADKIDKALLRPGRIDRRFKFHAGTSVEARQMFRNFFGEHEAVTRLIGMHDVKMNVLQNIFSGHIDDPEGAVNEALTCFQTQNS